MKNMSCRRLALAPLVALVLSGLVGGPAASAATSSTAETTATSAAAKKKSSSKKKSSGKKKSSKKTKKKKVTVSSLDKRLKKTEKDLKAARNQIRTVQRATASLVGGLDTVAGASGSIDAAMAGFQGALVASAAQELAKFQAALDANIQQQIAVNANAVVSALANPAVKPQVEALLTGIFGVSPTVIGQSIADLGPTVTKAINQVIVQEQPVLFARVGGATSGAVVGADIPDDGYPVSVSGTVFVKPTTNAATDVELRAGVYSAEGDQPAAKVVLDSLEVLPAGGSASGGTPFGSGRILTGTGPLEISGGAKLARDATKGAGQVPTLDIASQAIDGSKITVSGASGQPVRIAFTARFTDDSAND